MFHKYCSSLELFTSNKGTSRASKKIKYYISYFGTAFERFLMESRRFFCGMFIFICRQSFGEPDIEKVDDVIKGLISYGDFLIEDFMEVSNFLRKKRFSDSSIHTRLKSSIEGNIRSCIHIVLDPEANSSRLHS